MMRPVFRGGLAATVLIATSGVLAQSAPQSSSQSAPQPSSAPAGTSAAAGTSNKQNLAEEIKLLRKDVRAQKQKIMGAAMGLDEAQSKKFWPIYKDFDRELAKLNDARVGGILAYAQNYNNMTENKADELVNGAIAFHKKRIDLVANTYDKVRAALGAPLGARFVQVESMVDNLIDLQIQSNLPLMWGPEKQ